MSSFSVQVYFLRPPRIYAFRLVLGLCCNKSHKADLRPRKVNDSQVRIADIERAKMLHNCSNVRFGEPATMRQRGERQLRAQIA